MILFLNLNFLLNRDSDDDDEQQDHVKETEKNKRDEISTKIFNENHNYTST